jgi:hypothetical protein
MNFPEETISSKKCSNKVDLAQINTFQGLAFSTVFCRA